jgi:hypothetical protein
MNGSFRDLECSSGCDQAAVTRKRCLPGDPARHNPDGEARCLAGPGLRRTGWNAEEMENHGTSYETRFKKLRERIEVMKVIWTKEKAEYHREVVDFPSMMTGPKSVQKPQSAEHRRWRLPLCGAARNPLWRRHNPSRFQCRVGRARRIPAAFPPVERRGWPRSQVFISDLGWWPGGSRPSEPVPRSWRCADECPSAIG